MMLCVAHFYGCMWIWVGSAYPSEVEEDGTITYSWLKPYALYSEQRQYLTALYWAITTLVTVGYVSMLACCVRVQSTLAAT